MLDRLHPLSTPHLTDTQATPVRYTVVSPPCSEDRDDTSMALTLGPGPRPSPIAGQSAGLFHRRGNRLSADRLGRLVQACGRWLRLTDGNFAMNQARYSSGEWVVAQARYFLRFPLSVRDQKSMLSTYFDTNPFDNLLKLNRLTASDLGELQSAIRTRKLAIVSNI